MSDRLSDLRQHLATVGPATPIEPSSLAIALGEPDLTPNLAHELICSEFPFLRNSVPLTARECAVAAGLLAWIDRELAAWRSSSSASAVRLTYLLCAIGVLGWTSSAWGLVTSPLDKNADLLHGLRDVLRSSDPGAFARHQWQQRYGESRRRELEDAASREDWQSLDAYMHGLLDLLHDPIANQCVHALKRFDPASLAGALDEATSVFTLVFALNTMQSSDALNAAAAAATDRVKFWAVWLAFDGVRVDPAIDPLVLQAQPLLSLAAADLTSWARWLAVLNKYPGRFPGLQGAFGKVLCGASQEAVAAYFASLNLALDAGAERDAVARCLEVVKDRASASQRTMVWAEAHRAWEAWYFGRNNPETFLFKLWATPFDFGVVGHFVEASPEVRHARLQAVEAELMAIEAGWHQSVSHLYTAYNRLRSAYQPLAHAIAVLEGDGHWLQPRTSRYKAQWETAYRELRYSPR